MCVCVCVCVCVCQGAVCPPFFPLPVPAPGFYPSSLLSFMKCVPDTACPGVAADNTTVPLSLTPFYTSALLGNATAGNNTLAVNASVISAVYNLTTFKCSPGAACVCACVCVCGVCMRSLSNGDVVLCASVCSRTRILVRM